MEFSVSVEGLDRLASKSQPVDRIVKEEPHKGKQIAALMRIGLEQMKRRGLVREHGD